MIIREIEKKDNKEVENLIRTCLIEYGANKPGFAWSDPKLKNLDIGLLKKIIRL